MPRLALTTDPASKEPRPYLQDRETLGHFSDKMVAKDALNNYIKGNNAESLDGLPGLRVAMKDSGKNPLYISGRIWMCRYRRPLELVAVMVLSVVLTVLVMWVNGSTTL